MKKYYWPNHETGYSEEVSKEQYETLRALKDSWPRIEGVKGTIQIYGTGGNPEKGQDYSQFFNNNQSD